MLSYVVIPGGGRGGFGNKSSGDVSNCHSMEPIYIPTKDITEDLNCTFDKFVPNLFLLCIFNWIKIYLFTHKI